MRLLNVRGKSGAPCDRLGGIPLAASHIAASRPTGGLHKRAGASAISAPARLGLISSRVPAPGGSPVSSPPGASLFHRRAKRRWPRFVRTAAQRVSRYLSRSSRWAAVSLCTQSTTTRGTRSKSMWRDWNAMSPAGAEGSFGSFPAGLTLFRPPSEVVR